MKVKKFVNRMRNVLVESKTEWVKIAQEPTSPKQLFFQFILPIVILIAFATFTGTLVFGKVKLNSGTSVVFKYILIIAMVQCLTYVISSLIINEILPLFHLAKNKDLIFKLVAYSQVPVYIALFLSGLFPGLSNFLSIIAFYALVPLGYATGFLLGLEHERRYMFILASVITILLVYFALKGIFGIILV